MLPDCPRRWARRSRRARPRAADSLHVARMSAAGAIVIGKTNTPEFGLGSHTYNTVLRHHAQCLATRTQSPAAAAAARRWRLRCGMLPVADGSDMGGSLRNPAAFNNVFGLRPSRGRVPARPADELFLSAARHRRPDGAHRGRRRAPAFGAGRLRCPRAVVDGRGLADAATRWRSKAIRRVCASAGSAASGRTCRWKPACANSASARCSLSRHRLPSRDLPARVPREQNWTAWLRLRQLLVGGKLAALHADGAHARSSSPRRCGKSRKATARLPHRCTRPRSTASNVYRAFAARCSSTSTSCVAPTAQVFPFDASLDWPKSVGGVAMDTYHRWMEIVTPFTLAGVPTLNVRAGFNEAGLPMGLQLAGPIRSDLAVLRLGHAYDVACGWGAMRPPVSVA